MGTEISKVLLTEISKMSLNLQKETFEKEPPSITIAECESQDILSEWAKLKTRAFDN